MGMPSLRNEAIKVTINHNIVYPLRIKQNVSMICSPVKQKVRVRFLKNGKSEFFSGKVSSCVSPALQGGMTVEAAILMPFFLLLILSLLSFLEIIRLHNTITMGLREAGAPITVYGYAYTRMKEEKGIDLSGIVPNVILSYGYVGNKVREFAGEEYLENSPLSGGAGSIQYWQSSILEKDDLVDLKAIYTAELDFNVAFLPKLRLVSRYYGRAWTGYQVGGKSGGDASDVNVYVTPGGTVYHRNRYCTHLQLSIESVSWEELQRIGKEDGGRYRSCNLCGKGVISGKVYITSEGDCYHTSIQCSGLKRTIDVIPLSKVGNRGPCSRCGGS